MAARRSSPGCLFCQSRQSLVGRRRIIRNEKRRLETVAFSGRPGGNDGIVLYGPGTAESRDGGQSGPPAQSPSSQWSLQGVADEVREAYATLESLVQGRHERVRTLRKLSNPWPTFQKEYAHNHHNTTKAIIELPEAKAAPVPHAVFREHMKGAPNGKAIRQVLRLQLLRCERPKELFRIVAVAMQNQVSAEAVSILHEPIMRALYRCRNYVSDPQVLSTISTLVSRFTMAKVHVHEQLLHMGLKFAARSRSVTGMQKYLRLIRARGEGMSSNVFRSVIAKFSIGHRGLGEIRNGRWRRRDLLQVLKGFEGAAHLPLEQQYHLETFLDRDDWQYLHGWIAVLARCKANDIIWEEWLLWKESIARKLPKRLESQDRNMNTKVRGDYWFVEQMTYTGDLKRAWAMLQETTLTLPRMKARVRNGLLEGVEHVGIWTPQLRDAMLEKYDTELTQIEKAFGVKWEPGQEGGGGQHVTFRDQGEALEDLGKDDWQPEIDYGFPYEESPVVRHQERSLQYAEVKEET